jgi:hypothetical protein
MVGCSRRKTGRWESQQLGLRRSKHTHKQHHDKGPEVTVEVRIHGGVTVADVEEDNAINRLKKSVKRKRAAKRLCHESGSYIADT